MPNRPTLRGRLIPAVEVLELTALGYGGGRVDEKGKREVRRCAEGQGVRADHRSDAEGRRNSRAGVGDGQSEHVLPGRHERIVSGKAVVGGVSHGHGAHAIGSGLFHCGAHGPIGDDVSHAVVTVEGCRGLRLADRLDLGGGRLDPGADPIVVHGQSADPVRIDPPEV